MSLIMKDALNMQLQKETKQENRVG